MKPFNEFMGPLRKTVPWNWRGINKPQNGISLQRLGVLKCTVSVFIYVKIQVLTENFDESTVYKIKT
jgi:hypothetical protein